jgi:hypothetical protein
VSFVKFDFLNWRPDVEVFNNEGLVTADNVLHQPRGYQEVRFQTAGAYATTSGNLTVLSSVVFTSEARHTENRSGAYTRGGATTTGGQLFIMGAAGVGTIATVNAATMISTGSMRVASITESFLGSNSLLCSLARYTGSGGTETFVEYAGVGTYTFTSIPESPFNVNFVSITSASVPTFHLGGRMGQFLAGTGHTDVNGKSSLYTVRWSAIGDASDWPTVNTDDARAKQAGEERLDENLGFITGITGDEFNGWVFQQRGITKFTYVGGDVVWNVDTIERGRGCGYNNRFVHVDDKIFFESEHGYHVLQNNEVIDIGKGRVDATYPPLADIEQKNVCANAKLGIVFFHSQNLAYNWKTDQWSRVPALSGAASIYSLDTDEGIIGQVITSNNSFQITDSSGKAAATATVETGDFNLNPGGRAVLDGIRPINETIFVPTITVGVRDSLDFNPTTCTGSSIDARSGMSHFRGGANVAEGRYHNAKLVYAQGFTSVAGVEIDFKAAGK